MNEVSPSSSEKRNNTKGTMQNIRITKTQLTNAGWTDTAITRFLPRPRIETSRNYYGSYSTYLWDPAVVLSALHQESCRTFFAALQKRRDKKDDKLPRTLSLLDATREASRSAHRWRDRASDAWESGRRRYAGTCSSSKRYWYSLKERGIIAMHRSGELRYAGASPQGMAVYEYGDGGMQCFHSTLHPAGAERVPVPDHPEVLLVAAKMQELRLLDVEHTLERLLIASAGYVRSESPAFRRERQQVTCYRCGDPGHVARECAEEYDSDLLAIRAG